MRIKIFYQEKKHNAYIIVLSECAYFNMSLDLPTYKLLYSEWDYTFNSYEPRAKEWIIISNEGYLEVSYDLSNLPSHHIQSFSHLASELLAREFDISIRDFNNKLFKGIEKQSSFPQRFLLQIVICLWALMIMIWCWKDLKQKDFPLAYHVHFSLTQVRILSNGS